ncbi:hypothetical protein BH20VER1_BH20VER1_29280 [soil metagenome]
MAASLTSRRVPCFVVRPFTAHTAIRQPPLLFLRPLSQADLSGSAQVQGQQGCRIRFRVVKKKPAGLGAVRGRRKFLHYFPEGFRDRIYLEWERSYKWETHERWEEALHRDEFRRLLEKRDYSEVAARAVRTEQRARHSMIFSFEKMALRDAVKSPAGAKIFAKGLYEFLHGPGSTEAKFGAWCETVASLPRRQTRVLTWPLVTVWGFIARPKEHIFLKPNATKIAARAYGFDFRYQSKPTWETYASLLEFAATVRRDVRDLRPRDMIDLQSFIWVQGSDEYLDKRV